MRPSSEWPDRKHLVNRRRGPKRASAPGPDTQHPNGEYRVGPGRPPKEYQFKPGQSGNPKGAKRKTPSIELDLKALLERALTAKVKLRRSDRDKIVTKAEAGIEHLVDQFAKGDPHGRRDFILLCKNLGIDLTNRQALEGALEDVLSAEDEALLADFVKRHGGQYPVEADPIRADPAKDANVLPSPSENAKLLGPPTQNLTDPQMRQTEEKLS